MSLRTLEKKLSKSKRRQADSVWDYRPRRKKLIGGKLRTTQQRSPYFRIFRRERQVLNILSKCPPDFYKKTDRTIVRRVYYRTLPFLFSRLSLPKDRQILFDIEEYYFGFLTIVKLQNGKDPNTVSRLNWDLRHLTSKERVSLSKQSSIEPMFGFGSSAYASAAPSQ